MMRTKTSVLFFCPVPDFRGGAERSLFDLMRNPSVQPFLAVPGEGPVAEAARQEGIPVDIVDFGAVNRLHRPVTVTALARALRDWWKAAALLRRLARAYGAQLVHSNGMKAHFIALLARYSGGVPVVTHVRDIAVRRSEEMAWKTLGHMATHMVLVSRACWPGDTLPAKVSVIHNGTVLPDEPIASHKNAIFTLGICGRIHPFKGLDTALDWVAKARADGFLLRLVVRGEAIEEQLPYVESLEKRVIELGLNDVVEFQGRKEGLEAIYGGLDAVIVPSVIPDPLPRSVMEAMAMGVPVMGYPAGGIPEMIDDGVNGWLIEDSDAFVAALRMISAGGDGLEDIRRAARNTIVTKFSLPGMYERLNGIYDGLVSR